MMRRASALALVAALSAPLAAQTPDAPPEAPGAPECWPLDPACDRLPRLFQDLERDLGPLFRDLDRDVGPMLEGLGRRMELYLRDLDEMLGDLTRWEAPEILPNGDILIRRRPAPPPDQSPESDAPESDAPVTEPFEL